LKSGNGCDGLCKAIDRCGEILAQHSPRSADDRDELPTKLVTEGYRQVRSCMLLNRKVVCLFYFPLFPVNPFTWSTKSFISTDVLDLCGILSSKHIR
jgi:hypothetical protein